MTGQSSGATDKAKASKTVFDDKLESMNEDVNEMEPGCDINPASEENLLRLMKWYEAG